MAYQCRPELQPLETLSEKGTITIPNQHRATDTDRYYTNPKCFFFRFDNVVTGPQMLEIEQRWDAFKATNPVSADTSTKAQKLALREISPLTLITGDDTIWRQ